MFLLLLITLFASLPEEPLWRGDFIQLEERAGFLVLTHQAKKPLSQFEREELLEWEKSAAKLEQVFQKVFTIGDYYRTIPLEEGPAEMTLIPVGAFDKEEGVNLFLEAKNTLWIVGGRKDLIPPLQKEEIEKIRQAAAEILPYEVVPIPLVYGKNKITSVKPALEFVQEEWNSRFAKEYPEKTNPLQNISCEGELPPLVVEKQKMCRVFCNPEVIARQKIFEAKENLVLVNYLPYTYEEHLLLIPKRHIEKISGSTDEEIVEKYQLVELLRHALEELFPGKKIVLLTKAGWKGNQTENHLHDHIIVYDPEGPHRWMYNWLTGLASLGKNRAPTLTVEEMQARGEKILERMLLKDAFSSFIFHNSSFKNALLAW